MSNKTVVVIAGPTAVGKTGIAIQLAKHLGTEIISADSRQCYRELNIGVARPSPDELEEVPHHFIASHSVNEKITAAAFAVYALEKANTLFKKHDAIVMVGGTGLYIRAFCEGMDPVPEVPEAVREDIVRRYNEHGLPWLQQEVQRLDPAFYSQAEIMNPHRLIRALEVLLATGRSVLDFRKGVKEKRGFNVVKVALEIPKAQLHHNIAHRVDVMMEQGLLEEVRSLLPYRELNALQTVGYKELFAYLDGQVDLASAIESIKTNTRQYAKRQVTWFRKDKEYHWLPPDAEAVVAYVDGAIGRA